MDRGSFEQVPRMNNLFINSGAPHFVILACHPLARREPILALERRHAAYEGLFFAESYKIETAVQRPSRHILQIDCHGHLSTAKMFCLIERK